MSHGRCCLLEANTCVAVASPSAGCFNQEKTWSAVKAGFCLAIEIKSCLQMLGTDAHQLEQVRLASKRPTTLGRKHHPWTVAAAGGKTIKLDNMMAICSQTMD